MTADAATFCYEGIEQYWQNARGTGVRRFLDSLDAEQTAAVRTALAERVRSNLRSDGLYLDAVALIAVAGRED